MDQNFLLIKCVDPGKSTVKIKDRFAKLTLNSSSRKKLRQQEKTTMEQRDETLKSHASRNLYREFLTDDDDSDVEVERQNRIFRSKTTSKASEDNGTMQPVPAEDVPRRRTKSFSQQLALSDSDETNCSLEQAEPLAQTEMERLQISLSQPAAPRSAKLFTDSSPSNEKDLPLRQLSSRLSSLGIKDKPAAAPEPVTSDERRDARLEDMLRQYKEKKESTMAAERPPNRYSVMTISSNSTVTSPISLREEDDTDKTDDEDSDVVIISDSEEEGTSDAHYPVSLDRIPGEHGDTISETQLGRLDAFFDNIPTLAPYEGPERIFAPIEEPINLTKSNDGSIPEESIEICESSPESEKGHVPANRSGQDSPSKSIVQPAEAKEAFMSPQKRTKPRQLIVTPEIIDKLASPRRRPTPNTKPTSSKQTQTPKYMAKTPLKARTPRKTPTPKNKKQREKSPPAAPVTIEATATSPTPPALPQSAEPAPSVESSPEFRVEKINISATIKIKLQFNDEMVASFHASPSTNLPRLTESESITTPPQEQVRTPDNLKHRSYRDPQMLTFVDASKVGETSPSKDASGHDDDGNMFELLPPIEDPAEEIDQLAEMLSSSHIVYTPSPNSSTPHRAVPASPETLPPLRLSQSPENPSSSPMTPLKELENSPPPPNASNSCPKETSPEVVLDDTAQRILDELYGDGWKTPAVVKTLKKAATTTRKAAQPAITVDESVMDFTKFHKNIRCDLESTRLLDMPASVPKTPASIFKVPSTDRKVARSRKDVEKKPASEKKPPRRNAAQTPKSERRKPIPDSDDLSDSNSDFDASTDTSWKDVFSYSSHDSDNDAIETPARNRTKRTKKKNSSKDELIYLDLSSDIIKVQEVNDSPCANNDEAFQERLQELLKTYKCPDKKKIEPEPTNKKTKRKLFTPRFGDEDETSPIASGKSELSTPDNDVVVLTAPLPAMFEPINKHLESVKTGKPIFKLTTPKSVTKKNKENIPGNESATPKPNECLVTPKRTPKTQSRSVCKNRNNSEFDLMSTPIDKYGFLQSLDVKVSKSYCHPDALIYRENYRTRKQELAEKLLAMYNKNVFNGELNVPLVWNKKLLNTAGRCSCSTKLGKRLCRVELSDKVLTSADRLRCTLIHELCHAATWIYNGEHGHGATWKKWACRANSIFPELPKIGVCHDYDIDYKYTYKCTLCSAKSHAHSKSKKVENIRCAYCHGAIEVFLNKKDKEGNVLPTPVKEATGFAKFVKDNYKKFKKPELKHADVMKVLSSEYAALNVAGKKGND